MAYVSSWSGKGAIFTFTGLLTTAEVNEANGSFHGHPEFDSRKYCIWNYLNADLSGIAVPDGRIPAAIDKGATMTLRNLKVAFAAVDPHSISIIDFYIEYSKQLNSNWQYCIFTNLDDALAWAETRVA